MEEKNEFSFSLIVSILVLFITICGGLWHIGYWSTFKFNYLEYASVADIFKSTIYPFFSENIGLLGMMLMIFCLFYLRITPHRIFKRKPVIDEVTRERNEKRLLMVIDLAIVLFGLISAFFISMVYSKERNTILTLTLPFFFWLFFWRNGLLRTKIQNEYIRFLLIGILSFYPIFSFFTGKLKSNEIKSGLRYMKIIEVSSTDSSLNKSFIGQKLLESTESHFFFLNNKQEISIVGKDVLFKIVVSEVIDKSRSKVFQNNK